ncbi:hypothetical protein EJ02DRAFT_378837 [Clathrospora elynae]|uniref:Uncharacterized protein n=1 Tax=Clathrospora elynae TaxID=706981 RepID=A0A6A5SV42_9PLEO|nr:hypothetical protein EJ02DRAFT_378837 [Clathrospora elynae]
MSRSLEVGRAVLCSPTTNLELWLTTLITISPKQGAINFQQLKPARLLDLLSSGSVWVGRDHGMHIELRLTLAEECLDRRQLRDLTESILRAPVWEQLMLRPTPPVDAVVEPGTIRLDISHAGNDEPPGGQKPHRLFSNVPAADTRPPEDIPTASLQYVRLSMDLLETSTRRRPPPKRSHTSPDERQPAQAATGNCDVLLYDMLSVDNAPHEDITGPVPTTTNPSTKRKRKRPATDNVMLTLSTRHESSSKVKRGRTRPATDSVLPHGLPPDPAASDRAEIENMMDGALRLSVCGGLTKPVNGLKIKANTFRMGLADIAPVIWRFGHLSVRALSQRAHLLPTIGRSLSQVACVRATSISLKDKVMNLTTCQGLVAQQDASPLASSVACRLWVHLQKNLSNKCATPLQAFLASNAQAVHSNSSDDMLAEVVQEEDEMAEDELILHQDPSPSFASTDEKQLEGQTSRIPEYGAYSGELEDDLLLDTEPLDIVSIDNLGEDQPVASHSGNDVLDSIHHGVSYGAAIHEPQDNFGTDHTADEVWSSYEPCDSPMLAEAEELRDELLFEGCG